MVTEDGGMKEMPCISFAVRAPRARLRAAFGSVDFQNAETLENTDYFGST